MRKSQFVAVTIIIFLGFVLRVEAQSLPQEELERLFFKIEQGDYDQVDMFLGRADEASSLLREHAEANSPRVRETALELLGKMDLRDDNILNQDEIISAMIKAIDGLETDESVINTALWYLQRVDTTKTTPLMIQASVNQLENGYARAAHLLGRLGDRSLIPTLEHYAASQDKAVAEASKEALAKLGEQRYLAEILAELDSGNVHIRDKAFEKLSYIGNKATVRRISQFLWYKDTSASEKYDSEDSDIGYVPPSFLAAETLGKIVDNPPMKRDADGIPYPAEDIGTWQDWWEAHQYEYP